MKKAKLQSPMTGHTGEAYHGLLKILSKIKDIILKSNFQDKWSKEEILEAIDSMFQTQTPQKKNIETIIFSALETLEIMSEEGFQTKSGLESDLWLVEEMFILGKLLDQVYICSTDIEYAQYYNKELAIRVDRILNSSKLKLEARNQDGSLSAMADKIFNEIDNSKTAYFKFPKKPKSQRALRKVGQKKTHSKYSARISGRGVFIRLTS